MPRKKKPPLSFVERMQKIRKAQLLHPISDLSPKESEEQIGTIENRVKKLLGIVEQLKKQSGKMLFFVMYDIESNKVRALVHKYLERRGCTPIQRSIFLGNTSTEVYSEIKKDLTEVQEAYENNDSIIVLPITTDYLRMMKIIGQKIDIDIITHSKSTLFF